MIAGDCDTDIETGVLFLESPDIALPSGSGVPRVAFDHWVATEADWAGGNIKIKVNNGPWILVPSTSYTFNPYNAELVLELGGNTNTNPMAGESAFSGTDDGSVEGSWGQSQIDLSGFAGPGDVIRLRFELGIDGCNGAIGWYVDTVRAVLCVSECTGGCGIDGECRVDGELNPANACQICDRNANRYGWSSVPLGTACEADGDQCTMDHCDGIAACVTFDNVACQESVPPCEGGAVCNQIGRASCRERV